MVCRSSCDGRHLRAGICSLVLLFSICSGLLTSSNSRLHGRKNLSRQVIHDVVASSSSLHQPNRLSQQRPTTRSEKDALFLLHLSSKSESESQPPESGISDKVLGSLVLLSVPLSWGTYGPVIRYLYAIQPPVPGFVFSACYYALAASTTITLARWQDSVQEPEDAVQLQQSSQSFSVLGGLELGSYLFVANCLQVVGLQTVSSDRAGFLVQLTTVMVPFVEATFAGRISSIPVTTWFACLFAFFGLFVMGLDGKPEIFGDPIDALFGSLSAFTPGDGLIVGAAVLYTLHVVRLSTYAQQTTPMKLAASKATVETILSLALLGFLSFLSESTLAQTQSGVIGFASATGKEISNFFDTFSRGIADGTIPKSALLSAGGAVLWTGWVTCAYTIYAQSFGQRRVSPTNANLIYTFQPIFTALFAYILLGETMGPAGFTGGAIIAASVFVVASSSMNDDDP